MNGEARHELIETYWYSIDWDVEAIWQLNLPVVSMEIDKLAWHLDVPVWPFAGQGYCVTPRQVMSDPRKYEEEYRRVQAADESFPIDVIHYRERWMILDGIHRLSKAVQRGATSINVRIVPDSEIQSIAGD